jgi:hypothetical protein
MHSYLHACHAVQSNSLVMWFTGSVLVSLLIWISHYVAVFLTVGSMVMMSLRVLGIAGKSQTVTEVSDYYSPWMWIGLTVLTFSGILMLAGDSDLFCTNGVFAINMIVTVVAAAVGVFIRNRATAWDRPSGTPLGAKFIAGFSILLWMGTILSAVEVPARSNVP